MAKISSDTLVKLVLRSGLVDDEKLACFLDQFQSGSGQDLQVEAPLLVEEMVQAGLINSWHADNLLKGKYKGFRLGKYRILGHLGTGGMSSVFLAEHPVMRRLVAVKVLPKNRVSDSNYLERFRREAQAVAALDHSNIVRAYDIDQDGDTHYIVMEYVNGRDLQQLITAEGPLSPEVAADYIQQVAVGLQHAHDAGLIHRDVKPANCLVDSFGTVKLLDLGLAKFSESVHSISAVYDDRVVGTADYLSPEQALNSQTVDARADIYSLGCTLYFLLTGHPPFPTGTIAERLLKHQKVQPSPIRDERNDVPATLVDICDRMMRKSPEQRIATAADVASELSRWLAARRGDDPLALGQSSRPGSVSRLEQLVRRGDSAGGSGDPGSGDTARLSADETRTANDDLALAPLEGEAARAALRDSSASSEETEQVAPQLPQPDLGVVPRAFEGDFEDHSDIQLLQNELRREGVSSGLLDDLEGDPLVQESVSNIHSSRRLVPPSVKEARTSLAAAWIWLGGGVAGLVLFLMLVWGLSRLL